MARKTGVDQRLADRQARLSSRICQFRRGRIDQGQDSPPAVCARLKWKKFNVLPGKLLRELAAGPFVEIGVARRRAGRIDTGDFDPSSRANSRPAPIETTRPLALPAPGQGLVCRIKAARISKRHHGGQECSEAQAYPKRNWLCKAAKQRAGEDLTGPANALTLAIAVAMLQPVRALSIVAAWVDSNLFSALAHPAVVVRSFARHLITFHSTC